MIQREVQADEDVPEISHRSREAVVLIHGLASNRLLLLPLWYQMKAAGYQAKLYGYFTFFSSIETHAQHFSRFVQRLESNTNIERWHIVAHSMGAIITRQMLCSEGFEKLGRVVMLGPPNGGSPAARMLSYLVPLSKTVQQISDDETSFVRTMGAPGDVEIGVVAARHDRVVDENSSHLATESDHVTVYGGHNGLLVRPGAAKQILSFLDTGQFQRDEAVNF